MQRPASRALLFKWVDNRMIGRLLAFPEIRVHPSQYIQNRFANTHRDQKMEPVRSGADEWWTSTPSASANASQSSEA
jgi:hypothetical protein